MKTEYREVKPKKNVICFLLGISVVGFILVALGRQWQSFIIPLMFSLLAFIHVRNDRIIYNDQEVILFTPLGKKIVLSWRQIKNVEVQYKSKLERGGITHNWYLNVTYMLEDGRTESLEKLYYDYDGAGDFEDTYKRINHLP